MNYTVLIPVLVIIITLVYLFSRNPEVIIKDIFKIAGITLSDKPSNEPLTITVNNKQFYKNMVSNGELGFAESYMDGHWDCSDLSAITYQLLINLDKLENALMKQSLTVGASLLKQHISRLFQYNTREISKKMIEVHYDIGNDLYEKMLGKTMGYTCAYYYKPNMTLDEAQIAKFELVARKLHLKEGMTVLDMGCGWGQQAKYIADKYKVTILAVSLSKEQINWANENNKSDRVTYKLMDYRDVKGKFDRVYSIGMLEHVGLNNYPVFFNKSYDVLKDDGILLVHFISTNPPKAKLSPFIDKYIFPNAYIPKKKDIIGSFLDNKWSLEDWQNIGVSYNTTLLAWYDNIKDWKGLDNYDKRFRRMWEFYLLGCASSFKAENDCLWQIVFTKLSNKKTHIYRRVCLD